MAARPGPEPIGKPRRRVPPITALPQSVRFLGVGGAAALINWLARFPLSLVLPFWLAVVGATLIGMVFGFVAYNAWVFPGSTRAWHLRLGDFIAVNLVGLGTVTAVASLTLAILARAPFRPDIAEAVSHAIGIAAGAVINFVGHRRVTYR